MNSFEGIERSDKMITWGGSTRSEGDREFGSLSVGEADCQQRNVDTERNDRERQKVSSLPNSRPGQEDKIRTVIDRMKAQ